MAKEATREGGALRGGAGAGGELECLRQSINKGKQSYRIMPWSWEWSSLAPARLANTHCTCSVCLLDPPLLACPRLPSGTLRCAALHYAMLRRAVLWQCQLCTPPAGLAAGHGGNRGHRGGRCRELLLLLSHLLLLPWHNPAPQLRKRTGQAEVAVEL